MGEPVLLPVWIPVPRIHYSDYFLLTDLNCYGLLPAVRRGNLLQFDLEQYFFIQELICQINDIVLWQFQSLTHLKLPDISLRS